MLPIRDHNPSEQTPWVTYALIAVNVAIFLSYWGLFSNDRAISMFFLEWGMVPVLVTEQGTWGTMFSSMFLHGSIMHLLGRFC